MIDKVFEPVETMKGTLCRVLLDFHVLLGNDVFDKFEIIEDEDIGKLLAENLENYKRMEIAQKTDPSTICYFLWNVEFSTDALREAIAIFKRLFTACEGENKLELEILRVLPTIRISMIAFRELRDTDFFKEIYKRKLLNLMIIF